MTDVTPPIVRIPNYAEIGAVSYDVAGIRRCAVVALSHVRVGFRVAGLVTSDGYPRNLYTSL